MSRKIKEAKGKWQPIETAPRDGTPVDLWHKSGFRITDTWWNADDQMWAGIWSDSNVTHWMPVPDPSTGD